MADDQESIDFFARYKDWVVVKRMAIRPDTKPEEIAFHLAGIRQTLDKKAYSFLGIDTQKLDTYAASLTSGKKKNYNDLAEVIAKLGSKEAKNVVREACGAKGEASDSSLAVKSPDGLETINDHGTKKDLSDVTSTYLLRKAFQNLGFDVDVNQEMLSKIYNELKIKKPLGRKAKE